MKKDLKGLPLTELSDLLALKSAEYTNLYFENVPTVLLRSLKKEIRLIQEQIHKRKEKAIKE